MEQLLQDISKINEQWDIDTARSVLQKGIRGQKTALNSLLKGELLDLFVLMCQVVQASKVLDQTEPKTEENCEIDVTEPTKGNTDIEIPPTGRVGDDVTNATKLLQESDKNSERICRAYKQHVCSFGKSGKGCPFAHPARCKTFCDYGLKKFNQNGCDQKMCKLLHPRLCHHALKYGECYRRECKYIHTNIPGVQNVFPKKFLHNNNHCRSPHYNQIHNQQLNILKCKSKTPIHKHPTPNNLKCKCKRHSWQYGLFFISRGIKTTLVIVLDWKVGRTCRTMGNWMATRCGIYVVSTLRNRSILPDTTPSSIQDAKSTSLQCKGGNSCWWRITSCCKNCQQINKNCQQIDHLTCSWELKGTSLFRTTGIPWTTRWRLHNIVGSGPCNLGH